MKGLIKKTGLGGRNQNQTNQKKKKKNPNKTHYLGKKNSKYLDHNDIAMKKTTLSVFIKHISTTHCKAECCSGYCPQDCTTSFVMEMSKDVVFQAQEKDK